MSHSILHFLPTSFQTRSNFNFNTIKFWFYSMPVVEYSKEFITSVIVGKDVVPRIGLSQMEALRADLINAIKKSQKPKVSIIKSYSGCYCYIIPHTIQSKNFAVVVPTTTTPPPTQSHFSSFHSKMEMGCLFTMERKRKCIFYYDMNSVSVHFPLSHSHEKQDILLLRCWHQLLQQSHSNQLSQPPRHQIIPRRSTV